MQEVFQLVNERGCDGLTFSEALEVFTEEAFDFSALFGSRDL